jgi:DnaK suppressor protein
MSPDRGKGARKRKSLPKRTQNALRKQLEAEREQILEQIGRLEADFVDESWKESRSDDDAFAGSATFERERTMSLARNARAVLKQIDEALVRMDEGVYGTCLRCGQAIDPARLEALPQADYCLDCRREEERSAR